MVLPLSQLRILVTRPKAQAETFSQKLKDLGAIPLELPSIQVLPPHDWEAVDSALMNLQEFDWVVFTSANGVNFFLSRLKERQIPINHLFERKVATIGPATANALQKFGKAPDAIPDVHVSEAIADVLGNVIGKHILLPRANLARPALAQELAKRGALVTKLNLYRIESETTPTQIETLEGFGLKSPPHYITVTSSSSVHGLYGLLKETELLEWLEKIPVICIGPITALTVEELGYKPTTVASVHTVDGLIQALIETAKGTINTGINNYER